ncbi:MAG: class I SAM-dependent methyltransferase [Candidimonas sp.]|nr:MAG: class I SAM-dependent methyltransferase [Candidimonas sp.]
MSDGADSAHFPADWLALREPVDHRSRVGELTRLLARHLRACVAEMPTVVDLGAGCGSNLRYLSEHLPEPIRWRLLDHDAALLAAVPRHLRERDIVSTETVDLSMPLAPVLAGADLVTASALIDLASADWIGGLCGACAAAGAAVLIALTVDGRVTFADDDADDEWVRAAVARDQHRDKGLGLALGGDAPAVLIDALGARGYAVGARPSDWRLGSADAALAGALIDGWRKAAQRQCPRKRDAIARWALRRAAAVADGRAALTVGHLDVLGIL